MDSSLLSASEAFVCQACLSREALLTVSPYPLLQCHKSLPEKLRIPESSTVHLYENVSYQLPFESGDTFEGGKLYLFDDGSCFGEIRLCNRQNSSPERITRIYIHEGKMNILALDEVFNFRKQCIEKIQNSRDMNDYQAFFKNPYYNNRSYEIIDPTRRHYLISDIEYPYVVIDNKKYGKECAIHAWYRAEENAFFWITLENNQLVSYCYKI